MKFLKRFESFEKSYNPTIRYATPQSGNIMNFSIDDIKKIIMNSYKSEKGLPDRKMEEILNCEWLDVAEVVDLWYHMNPPTETGPNQVDSDVADFKNRPSAEEIYNYIQKNPLKYSKKLNDLNDKTGIFENVKVDTSKYDLYRTKYDLSEEEIDNILNKTSLLAPLNELSDEHNTTVITIETILNMHDFGLDRKSSTRLIPSERPSAKQIYNYLQTRKSLKNLELNKKTGIYETVVTGLVLRRKYELSLYEIEDILDRAIINDNNFENDSGHVDPDLHKKLAEKYTLIEKDIDDIVDTHFFGFEFYKDINHSKFPMYKRPSAMDIYKSFQVYKEQHPLEFSPKSVDFNKKTGLYN